MISKALMSAVLLVGVSSIAVAQSSSPTATGSSTMTPGSPGRNTSGTDVMKEDSGGAKTTGGMSGGSTDSDSSKKGSGASGAPMKGTAEPAGSGTSMGGSTTNSGGPSRQ
jgi:hypothetical protein